MEKRRTWKQFQDEKLLIEKKMQDEKESQNEKLIEKLKSETDIKEVAAAFTQEGFAFLLNTIGDIVEKRIDDVINKKMIQVLEGFQEGMNRALTNQVDKKVSEVEKQIAASIEPIVLHKVQFEEEEAPQQKKRKRQNNEIRRETHTFTGFEIPRSKKGFISWNNCNEDNLRDIIFHYMNIADSKDSLNTILDFKQSHPEANGVYQKISRTYGKGGWEMFLKEYNERIKKDYDGKQQEDRGIEI